MPKAREHLGGGGGECEEGGPRARQVQVCRYIGGFPFMATDRSDQNFCLCLVVQSWVRLTLG